tara:strand:+ start:507 stop:1091 length:585 start_codon:yes stop_codon:yes gene_type:complete
MSTIFCNSNLPTFFYPSGVLDNFEILEFSFDLAKDFNLNMFSTINGNKNVIYDGLYSGFKNDQANIFVSRIEQSNYVKFKVTNNLNIINIQLNSGPIFSCPIVALQTFKLKIIHQDHIFLCLKLSSNVTNSCIINNSKPTVEHCVIERLPVHSKTLISHTRKQKYELKTNSFYFFIVDQDNNNLNATNFTIIIN